MIDLHCHIIPKIDDGAVDLETAEQMLVLAATTGTKVLVATPHVIEGQWLPEWSLIQSKVAELQVLSDQAGLGMKLYPGAEMAMNFDLLNLIATPGTYCLNGSRYLLLELPAFEVPACTDDFLFRLQTKGIVPILAHPERHPVLMKEPERLLEWVQHGLLVQVNAGSILGKMGEEVQLTAEVFLKNQLVHCLGSDAHGVKQRRPILDEAVARIKELVGVERTIQITEENPGKILQNFELKVAIPEQLIWKQPRKGIFGFWKRH